MRNETRVMFNEYVSDIAKLNGVPDATKKFTVSPSVQQKIEAKQTESSAFLGKINVVPVDEQQGEKLGLGVGSPIASTTDTAAKDRDPADLTDMDGAAYACTQTNSDTFLTYNKLDMWAKFPNFQVLIQQAIIKRQALDRICIGFNGTSRAATSDRAANPLLQDVNVGWLEKLRKQAAARVMATGKTNGQVTIGANGDYANIDQLVFDMVNSLLDAWHAESPDLVAIVGRGLLADKYFPVLAQTLPSEQAAADLVISQKRMGGLQAVAVPFFPAGTIAITSYDNLSLYFQNGSRRRTIVDNAKRDRIEDYNSSNDAYVIEDLGKMCMAEKIVLA
ncbi:phage major capsid protein, P2 family [Paraburkholderia hospita]|nr:phage major capsid protein, P2 family [Paraburkholderia hospita]